VAARLILYISTHFFLVRISGCEEDNNPSKHDITIPHGSSCPDCNLVAISMSIGRAIMVSLSEMKPSSLVYLQKPAYLPAEHIYIIRHSVSNARRSDN
jgi:hypothetical protein